MTEIVYRRGDSFRRGVTVTLAAGTLAGAIAWFTIKRHWKDTDAEAVLLLRSDVTTPTLGSVVIDGDLHITVEMPASKGATIEPANYYFDVQVRLPSGEVGTPLSGSFKVPADITRATS